MLIDLVRIAHPTKKDKKVMNQAGLTAIDELMQTGKVHVEESEKTWENLKSEGKTWKEILDTIKIPHMALLRNLNGIFTEIEDIEIAKKVCEQLKSAFNAIGNGVHHLQLLKDTLQECLDISVANFPKLNGKTICLSDNSGSAWGALNSEYGTVKVAEIANLSSIITALQSDEGYLGLFGDN